MEMEMESTSLSVLHHDAALFPNTGASTKMRNQFIILDILLQRSMREETIQGCPRSEGR